MATPVRRPRPAEEALAPLFRWPARARAEPVGAPLDWERGYPGWPPRSETREFLPMFLPLDPDPRRRAEEEAEVVVVVVEGKRRPMAPEGTAALGSRVSRRGPPN